MLMALYDAGFWNSFTKMTEHLPFSVSDCNLHFVLGIKLSGTMMFGLVVPSRTLKPSLSGFESASASVIIVLTPSFPI
jgi:hypothetical protein